MLGNWWNVSRKNKEGEMEEAKLKEILTKHMLWLGDKEGGQCADLQGANLYGANLRYADLQGANLYGANLRYADLQGANLYGANLRYANLRNADLYGTKLRGADLRGSNIDFSCLPLSCGGTGIVLDIEQKKQLAYHVLKQQGDELPEYMKDALTRFCSDAKLLERHDLKI
jgi:hypothetical protein